MYISCVHYILIVSFSPKGILICCFVCAWMEHSLKVLVSLYRCPMLALHIIFSLLCLSQQNSKRLSALWTNNRFVGSLFYLSAWCNALLQNQNLKLKDSSTFITADHMSVKIYNCWKDKMFLSFQAIKNYSTRYVWSCNYLKSVSVLM